MADFTNTISTAVPGLGTPSQRQVLADRNQATGTGTSVLTFSPGIRKGIARVRTKGSITGPPTPPTTGVTTTSIVIVATDGFFPCVIAALMGGIGTANQAIDMIFPFNLDIDATTITLTLTTAGGTVFVDFEASGGA